MVRICPLYSTILQGLPPPLVLCPLCVQEREILEKGAPPNQADYVFVTPVEVDSGGSYISHDILHNRKRRSAHGASSSLHYRFSAFGQDLHLELKPSAILSSHFIVQTLKSRHVPSPPAQPGTSLTHCGLDVLT
ncbi:hypothetical protein A6R68_05387, partial [Neotoma lepida]